MNLERRILIIEDNGDDEALLLRQLKKAQFDRHVRVIPDGGRALAYLTEGRFKCEDVAAVFLDINLPKISGLTILETIRSSDRLRNLPVIVMTSSNAPEDFKRCRELGVSCFVQKPLTLSSFAKAFADTFHANRHVLQNGLNHGCDDDH
jgi:CheY-like chemotaxis protein